MTCNCQRVQGTNSWGSVATGIATGIGNIGRVIAPIVLPTVIGIGTDLLINKIVPKPTSPAIPAPVAEPVAAAQTERHETKVSTIVGVAIVAGLALYFLTKRRR